MKRRDDGKRKVSIAVLPDTYNTIRMPLRTVACWRLGDGVFRFDHKLIGREAKDEFDAFWGIRDRFPRAPIALFGHADPTGDDAYNHTLAAERATAVYAVLNADPDMWFELFVNDAEALASLKVLLRDYDVLDPSEEGFGPTTKEAVRAHFEYLGSGRRLEPFDYLEDGLAAIQSCSEFNPAVRIAVADVGRLVEGDHRRIHAANRRVLAYFFEPGTRVGGWWPCPVAGEGHDACTKRFWSDAETRRRPPSAGFEQYWPAHASGAPKVPYQASEELFACRFYERLARARSCELADPPTPRPPKPPEPPVPPDPEPPEPPDPPDPPPEPDPSDWEMHLVCAHAPESERSNRLNLGHTTGPDVFEVVAHGGVDTVHVHSEPPHLPITWSNKSDAPASGSTTLDIEGPKLSKVGLLAVYRAKPRTYSIRGSHLGIDRECAIRAYPPDEWKLDFEEIRKPLRTILGPGLWVWNNVIDKVVPSVEELGVDFLEADAVSGLMRVAWEEAPFDTGGAADPDYRAFPHFVFSITGDPVLRFFGELEVSIAGLLKLKKIKGLIEKLPKKVRDIVAGLKGTASTEVLFAGTQRVVVDSPDQDIRVGWDAPGKMEFKGSLENGLSLNVEHESSGASGSFSVSLKGSPVLGFIFDPGAERFGLYLEGTVGPLKLEISGEWKGVEPFDPIEEVVFEEEEITRREVVVSAAQFRKIFDT